VVQVDADDDGAWAVLGLAQTLLGNYRSAIANYRRATALSPRNPWYLHNLGHLLDVAVDRPREALSLLADAHDMEPKEREICASYAHALARTGQLALAKRVMRKVVARGPTDEHLELWRWLEQGAPAVAGAAAKEPPGRGKPRRRTRATSKRATTTKA
jgi:Flp pilus assembly protein TadD